MSESMYPQATKALAEKRSELAPEIESAFRQFSQAVFRDGTLPSKTKQLIAVAVAHVTQCPLYVVGCPAGGHIRWTARKAVSLRCPFGDRTRAVDPAPLFHAPLFRPDGILGRVAAQILCTRSLDAERLLCTDPMRRTLA